MNHTKTEQCYPSRFWGSHIYYCSSGAKTKCFKVSHDTKNTVGGVRFLLRFNMDLFLAQCEQVYLFLALAK